MEEQIQKGKLELDTGATEFQVESGSDDLAAISTDGNFDYYKEVDGLIGKVYLSNKDDRALDFLDRDKNFFFNIKLNESIPWALDIDAGAVSGELDLQNIAVEELDLDLGAGNIEVNLGKKAKHTNIKIDSGASKLVFNIPKGSGVSVDLEGGLNSTNFDELSLIKEGDRYVSQDFQDASSKFVINIDMGLGKFEINYY